MTRSKHVINLPNGAAAAVSSSINESGMVKSLVVVTANFTNAITTVITIDDAEGYTLYTSNALAENTENLGISLNIPVNHGFKVIATPSGDPGAGGGDVNIALYISDTDIRS